MKKAAKNIVVVQEVLSLRRLFGIERLLQLDEKRVELIDDAYPWTRWLYFSDAMYDL